MAAFTAQNPADKDAFMAHWQRITAEESIFIKGILYEGQVAGSVLCHRDFGDPEISYWLGKEFWGQGIATAPQSGCCKSAASPSPAKNGVLPMPGEERSMRLL